MAFIKLKPAVACPEHIDFDIFGKSVQRYGLLCIYSAGRPGSAFCQEDDMGLLDGILGGVIGAEALSLVKGYIEKHGGIQGVVAEFEKTGFGQQAKSWVSTGPNLPISAEQIQQALGSEKVKELATKFGIPIDKVADQLAKYLPTAIDKATPEGKLPT
jgi:uncharacterized protein YidB (DUF937 family)